VFAVITIHRTVLEGQVEGAGAAEVLLLGTGATKESAARMSAGGEVEGDDVMAFGLMAAMGGEGGLVGDLEQGLMGSSISRDVMVFR
jgi:hypothetical protein